MYFSAARGQGSKYALKREKKENARSAQDVAAIKNVDLLVNELGDLWILHETRIQKNLIWLEYAPDEGRMFFCLDNGQSVALEIAREIPVNNALKSCLQKTRKAFVIKTNGDEIERIDLVPTISRDAP